MLYLQRSKTDSYVRKGCSRDSLARTSAWDSSICIICRTSNSSFFGLRDLRCSSAQSSFGTRWKAATTFGSNCLPAHSSNSAAAASYALPLRYTRSLVMLSHYTRRPFQKLYAPQDLLPMHRMFSHAHPLFVSQFSRFAQDQIRHSDLPDIMQQGPKLQRIHLFSVQAILAPK